VVLLDKMVEVLYLVELEVLVVEVLVVQDQDQLEQLVQLTLVVAAVEMLMHLLMQEVMVDQVS